MISDGRIYDRPLAKMRCATCGLVCFSARLASEEVAAIYSCDYKLPFVAGQGEDRRGAAYARLIGELIGEGPEVGSVLDVGCGTGSMLRALTVRFPKLTAVGVDPARTDKVSRLGPNLLLYSGGVDTQFESNEFFDIVVSINTIEHTVDPAEFLSALQGRVREGGRIAVICPLATPANCELLFYDHLWSLSTDAFAQFAAKAGLSIHSYRTLEATLSGFQMFVLSSERTFFTSPASASLSTADEASTYLTAWKGLDQFLCEAMDRTADRIQMFGAGQMAALLRAYAPRSFARVSRLVVDHPEEAWPLGIVERYRKTDHAEGWATLIGVHPSIQDMVAERVREDGGTAITIPSEIRR